MAKIQIEESLFYKLLSYHCYPEASEPEVLDALGNMIAKELEIKLDSIVRRNDYTLSKIAATEEEREAARKRYLDSRGIGKDFRY